MFRMPFDRAVAAVMISTGDQVLSSSGRAMAPVPRIDVTTDRKAKSSIDRVRTWLIDEACNECRQRSDDWNLRQFQRMTPRNVSMSDVDLLNLYLFNNVDGVPADCRAPAGGTVSNSVTAACA